MHGQKSVKKLRLLRAWRSSEPKEGYDVLFQFPEELNLASALHLTRLF